MIGRPFAVRLEARSALRLAWPGSSGEAWLSDGEREVYATLRDARRREAWLFGRLLGKDLILSGMAAAPGARGPGGPGRLEILSRDGLGRAIRPRVLVEGRLRRWALSLAHSDRFVLAVFSQEPGAAVGVDVTPVRPPRAGFLDLWFTPWEHAWIRAQGGRGPRCAAALWAVKEAFYKAVNAGERFAPNRIEVRVDPAGRYAVRCGGSRPEGPCEVRVAAVGD
ncbi:MAG TPA: 4'-phosphopantetheinyl transferase superfamily protein, partial [Candidatus Methylomirabilis sp.]